MTHMAVRGNPYSIFAAGRERYLKRSINIGERQTAFLDRIVVDIRLRHQVLMARSELLYALIEAAIRSGIDFSEAASQEEITELMLSRPRRRSNPAGSPTAKNRLRGRGRKQ